MTRPPRPSLTLLPASRPRAAPADDGQDPAIQAALDLHDGPVQRLVWCRFALAALPPVVRGGAASQLLEVDRALAEALADLRDVVARFEGDEVAGADLGELVEHEAVLLHRRTGLDVEVAVELLEPLGPELTRTAFRITQEALANAARHSGAQQVLVAVRTSESRLVVSVRDDGRGFDVLEADRAGGTGLRGMHRRAELAGGVLEARSQQGGPTLIRAVLPLRLERAVRPPQVVGHPGRG